MTTRRSAVVGVAVLAALGGGLGASCVGSVELRVMGRGEDCARDFGSSTAAAKIETFLAASRSLGDASSSLELEMQRHCEEGLAHAGLAVDATAPPASACVELGRWVVSESEALGSARLVASEPRCTQPEDAFAACVSRCELRYRPEDVNVVVDESGLLTAPQASPRCRASCETLGAIGETCTPPAVVASGAVAPTDPARVARLEAALGDVAQALATSARAERISTAARRLVAIAPVLPEAAATVSIRAVSCVSAASIDIRGCEDRLARVASDAEVLRPALLR